MSYYIAYILRAVLKGGSDNKNLFMVLSLVGFPRALSFKYNVTYYFKTDIECSVKKIPFLPYIKILFHVYHAPVAERLVRADSAVKKRPEAQQTEAMGCAAAQTLEALASWEREVRPSLFLSKSTRTRQ